MVGSVILAFAPGRIDDTIGFKVDNPAGIGGPFGHVVALLAGISQPLTVPLLVVALVSLALRQRRSGGKERPQLKWFTSSLVLYVLLVGVDTSLFVYYGSASALPGWTSLFNNVAINSYGLITIAAGIAILRYRLYDIDLINRTLVYSTLTVSLAAVYVGSVVLLQTAWRSLIGRESQLAVVASTLAIAALFNPLRRRIQAFVDRRFYHSKYDAAMTLEDFGSRLKEETDLDALMNHPVGVVREMMQPAHLSLWLRDGEL